MMRLKWVLVSLLVAGSIGVRAAEPAALLPSVTIPYYDYPPKMRIVDGKPEGPYIDQWEAIAARAGVRLDWVASSISEETAMLDRGKRPLCNTGRLVTPERLQSWIFLPYVYDWLAEDLIVTSPALKVKIAAHSNLKELLDDTSLHPTFVGGLAIGEGIEGARTHREHWRDLEVKSEAQAVRMVAAGRADYTLSNADQLTETRLHDPSLGWLATLRLPGMYPRTPVSVACTRVTPPALIEALGQAMRDLGYETATDVH